MTSHPPGQGPSRPGKDEAARDGAWHRLSIDEALGRVQSSRAGLGAEEARARLAHFGPNAIERRSRTGALRILLRQFTDFMILVLVGAAILSAALGDWHDAVSILIIVLLNGVLGFGQELRAERALEALARMAAPGAQVLREGKHASIPASELVPGDVVLLEAGAIVPADLRLIEVHRLRIDESTLTGESVPIDSSSRSFGCAAGHDAAPALCRAHEPDHVDARRSSSTGLRPR